MHRRHPLCVKEEKGAERKWEREGIRPHTPIFAYTMLSDSLMRESQQLFLRNNEKLHCIWVVCSPEQVIYRYIEMVCYFYNRYYFRNHSIPLISQN